MTQREESIVCNCISLIVLALAAGFIAGIKFPYGSLFEEQARSEEWFRNEAALVYTLAAETLENPTAERLERLKKTTERYNREAGRIRKWAYRCPPRFSLAYLGIEEAEYGYSKGDSGADRTESLDSPDDSRKKGNSSS